MTTAPLCHALAMYDFDAAQDNQISLCMGERVAVYRQEDSGWWHGVNANGQSGWFPASFVEIDSHDIVLPTADKAPSRKTSTVSNTKQHNLHREDVYSSTEFTDQGVPTAHPDWFAYLTDDGQQYYVNHHTGESSWELPSVKVESTKPPLILGLPPMLDPEEPDQQTAPHQVRHINIIDESHDSPTSQLTGLINTSFDSGFDGTRSPGLSFSTLNKRSSVSPSVDSVKSPKSARPPSFVDPNPVPQTDQGRYGYANNFWSDKGDKSGFDILVLKHRNGKEVCKDIAHFMAERAKIEEAYAKSIMELAKSHLADFETGTAKTAWNQLKFDMETQAKCRLDFADKIAKQVHQSIMDFKNEQKKMRKDYEATIAADRKALMEKWRRVQKLHAVYLARAREADAADALVARGQLDNMTRQQFNKIEESARKERKKVSVAAYDYRTAVDDYEKLRMQWEDNMISACNEFQQAEEERIDFLKQTLQKYLQVQKKVNEECKESSEMVENSFQAVSKEVDIELFVKSQFTGSRKPAPLQFEPYKNYF